MRTSLVGLCVILFGCLDANAAEEYKFHLKTDSGRLVVNSAYSDVKVDVKQLNLGGGGFGGLRFQSSELDGQKLELGWSWGEYQLGVVVEMGEPTSEVVVVGQSGRLRSAREKLKQLATMRGLESQRLEPRRQAVSNEAQTADLELWKELDDRHKQIQKLVQAMQTKSPEKTEGGSDIQMEIESNRIAVMDGGRIIVEIIGSPMADRQEGKVEDFPNDAPQLDDPFAP